jgi:hypothetical protein
LADRFDRQRAVVPLLPPAQVAPIWLTGNLNASALAGSLARKTNPKAAHSQKVVPVYRAFPHM